MSLHHRQKTRSLEQAAEVVWSCWTDAKPVTEKCYWPPQGSRAKGMGILGEHTESAL